jgi:hypothetical protein
MKKALIMFVVKLRWLYFHLHPHYQKFYMDSGKTEAHFWHSKTNTIHSNLVWVDSEPAGKGGE